MPAFVRSILAVAIVLLCSPLHATCTFGFLSPTTYAANNKPGDVTTGDFNEDGYVDVVVVNRTELKISILLGDAAGGLGDPTAITTDYAQGDIQAADFDNDGDLDVVIALPWSNNFTVYPHLKILLGNGNGGFTPVAYTSQQFVNQNPENIVLGDFNKDGKTDAATTKSDGSWSSMQNVGGKLAQKGEYDAGSIWARGIAVGDFDGDGNDDVAVSEISTKTVYPYFGVGDGTFTAGTTFSVAHDGREPTDLEAGDFNEDGKDDLAIVTDFAYQGEATGPIKIALSNGSARTFATPTDISEVSSPDEILVRDMDADGHLDLIVADLTGLKILTGVGDGTFDDAVTVSGSLWYLGIAIDDFDRDGGWDVVGTNFNGAAVQVLLNTCGNAVLSLESSANPVAQGTEFTVTGTIAPPAVAPTGTLTLERGTTTLDSTDLNADLTVSATMNDLTPGTYTMTLEYSGDSRFFPATKTLSQVVTTPPFGPPPGLNAISYGGPVQLSWYATANTDHYEVWRNNGAGWAFAGNAAIAAFTDNAAPSPAALLYRVRAVAANNTVSEYSTSDLAITYSFTDSTLSPGVTTAKLAHLTELRTAANAVRALASLGATSWAESSPSTIRASHVTELRTSIAAALSNLGLDAMSYTDDPLNVPTLIKATHFEQLRAAMR